MVELIVIPILITAVEYLFSPRVSYVKESSVLVLYYFAAKNLRKRIIFKI